MIPIKVEHPSALTQGEQAAVLRACAEGQHKPGALLPILHAVQDAIGLMDLTSRGADSFAISVVPRKGLAN